MTANKKVSKKKIISLAFYLNQVGDVTHNFSKPNATLSMASDRMQFKPAIDAALNAGFTSEIYSLHSENYSDIFKLNQADICLVTKMSANTHKLNQSMAAANLAALTLLKNEGAKVVVQCCDNVFANTSDLIRFYKCVFGLADFIIFPCDKLRQITTTDIDRNTKTFVIHDPWQIAKNHLPRKLFTNKRCRLVWFGNNKNISYLLKILKPMMNNSPKDTDFLFTIIGRREAWDLLLNYLKSVGCKNPNWRLTFVEWSNEDPINQLEHELAKAHISVIPSDPSDPLKAGVSHNRLVDSIRAGCVTIASPMESYLELSDLALLGKDFGKLLNEALNNYEMYCERLKKLRQSKLRKFDPEYNAKCWQDFWLVADSF